MKKMLPAIIFLLFITGSHAAIADAIDWNTLTPAQQKVLQPFQQQWSQLPEEKQLRLSRGAERWANMTPEQRQNAKQRFQRWRELPPDQRELLRARFEKFKQMTPEQRAALRKKHQWYRNLPPEQRKKMKQRWDDATPEQRAIDEVAVSTYAFEGAALAGAVGSLAPDNDQGEYYLTDAIGLLAASGTVRSVPVADRAEVQGVNSHAQLAQVLHALTAKDGWSCEPDAAAAFAQFLGVPVDKLPAAKADGNAGSLKYSITRSPKSCRYTSNDKCVQ